MEEEEKKNLIGETPEEQQLIDEMRKDEIKNKEIEQILIIQTAPVFGRH